MFCLIDSICSKITYICYMTLLIADSGSTKTSWLLITEKEEESSSIQTTGINPFFRSAEDIYSELKTDLLPNVSDKVDAIFFYGAGIINQERGKVIQDALQKLFPESSVEMSSDFVGAARALFGNDAGITCIMGTGSGACLYDGNGIIARVPSLGFILGDECSGAFFGKKLLSDYFKNTMPLDVQNLFEQEFDFTESEVLRRVYKEERPNKYLAEFAPFLSKYIEKDYCHQLVMTSMGEFFERNVIQLPEYSEFPIGFVGSVAWGFRMFINELAEEYGFDKPVILKDPIEMLKKFHTS